jgi:hypothetical protein
MATTETVPCRASVGIEVLRRDNVGRLHFEHFAFPFEIRSSVGVTDCRGEALRVILRKEIVN